MNGRKLLALVLFGALVGTGDSAEAPVYIRIIDGFGNHDWRKTTALVREVLERRGDLQVSVSNGKGRIHTSTFGHVWKDEDNPVAFRCGGPDADAPRRAVAGETRCR